MLILNLLPILPLDGGRILFSLLPIKQAQQYAQTERYGMWILITLLLLGGLNYIMQPLSILCWLVVSLLCYVKLNEYTFQNLLAAMRPNTLHLGHYFGALQYWKKFNTSTIAYLWLLTYTAWFKILMKLKKISDCVNNMVINWLAAGIDPSQATILFNQKSQNNMS